MTKYLEELLENEDITFLLKMIEMGIIDINYLIKEAIKAKNGKYLYQVALAISKLNSFRNEKGDMVSLGEVIKSEKIGEVKTELTRIKDGTYLRRFLWNIPYYKRDVIEFLSASEDFLDIESAINYLASINSINPLSTEELRIKKEQDPLLRMAIRKLIEAKKYDELRGIFFKYNLRDFIRNIILEEADSEFLKSLKGVLAKYRANSKSDFPGLLEQVQSALGYKELKEGVMNLENKFEFLKILYQEKDEKTIWNYKLEFQDLFREKEEEKGLTK